MFPFARPYPDEILAGAAIRGCRHFSLPLASLGTQLHARRGWRLTFLTAGHLARFSDLFRVDAKALLWDHTLYPYATAFAATREESRSALTEASPGTHEESLSPTQLGIKGNHPRRACRRCIDLELKTLGESYWHRSHQLPGVSICYEHRTSLLTANIVLNGPVADLALPHDAEFNGRSHRAALPWQYVADASVSLLNRRGSPAEYRPGQFYRDLAEQRGWLPSDRPVSQEPLIHTLESFYQKRLLSASGLDVRPSAWPSLMMQQAPGIPFVALKHVLLEQFLRHDEPQASFPFAHKPRGPSARDSAIRDAEFVGAARSQLRLLQRSQTKVSLAAWLTASGCWHAYRHGRASAFPRLSLLVEKFKRGSLALRPDLRLPLPSERQGPRRSAALSTSRIPTLSLRTPANGTSEVDDAPLGDVTRLDLIRSGALLSSKPMAQKLGVHWTEMKRLTRANRIFSVSYASRDFYPAFWSDRRLDRAQLEALTQLLSRSEGSSKYRFFVDFLIELGQSPLAALRTGRFEEVRESVKRFSAPRRRVLVK